MNPKLRFAMLLITAAFSLVLVLPTPSEAAHKWAECSTLTNGATISSQYCGVNLQYCRQLHDGRLYPAATPKNSQCYPGDTSVTTCHFFNPYYRDPTGSWTSVGCSCPSGYVQTSTGSYFNQLLGGYVQTGVKCTKLSEPTVYVTHSPASPTSGQTATFTANADAVKTTGYDQDVKLREIRIYVDNSAVKVCNLGSSNYVCTGSGKWRSCSYLTSYPGSGTCTFSSSYSTGTHTYFAGATDTLGTIGTSPTKSFIVTDTSSDVNNCGSVGNVCTAGYSCVSGVCTPPTPPDSDGDGVPNSSDSCPNQAGPASNNGCPLPPIDFTLSLDPTMGNANKGDTKDVNASLSLVSGSGSVAFSASNLPVGATASFTPTSCSPNCYSNVTIATTAATPVGWQLVTIKATSGSLVKTATYNLTILPGASSLASCGNLVCEYPETQSSCAADCKTTANIPSPVAPGDIVAVSVEFYDFRYLANQKVQIDLKINPENLAWTPANGCFFGGKIMGPAASGSVIQWPAGTVSTDGHFKITTTCAIPGTIAAGAHTLVATPTIF